MERVVNLASYVDNVGPAEFLVQAAVAKGSGNLTFCQTCLILTQLFCRR